MADQRQKREPLLDVKTGDAQGRVSGGRATRHTLGADSAGLADALPFVFPAGLQGMLRKEQHGVQRAKGNQGSGT